MRSSDQSSGSLASNAAVEARDRAALRFIHRVMGPMEHVRIEASDLQAKIRRSYAAELAELEEIGFNYLFTDGETFSLLRFPLILPALTAFGMWRAGEILTLYGGTRIMNGTAVLASKDQTTFANPSKLGVKMFTAFQDGSLLLSKNYVDETTPPPGVMKYGRSATIGETWISHQWRVQALQVEGKVALCDVGFAAYTKVSDQETAPW
jgi:hypothetical protein